MLCCVVLIKCFIHHQHKHTSKFINTPVNPLIFIIEQWNFAVSVMKSCWKHPYIFFWLEVWGRHELEHPFIRHAFDEYIMHSWNASDNKHVCKNIFSWIRGGATSSLVLQSDWSRSRDMSPTCANQNPAPAMTRILIGRSIWLEDSLDLIEKSCFSWPKTWERLIFLTLGKMNYSYYA